MSEEYTTQNIIISLNEILHEAHFEKESLVSKHSPEENYAMNY